MLSARCVDSRVDFHETTRDDMVERHCICLISFHSKDVFCAPSRLFVRTGFRFFCARLAVHYLAVYLVLRSSIKQRLTATSTMTVQACIIILCSLLCCWLQKVTKQQRVQ